MSVQKNTPSLLGEMGEVLMNNSLSRSQLDGQPSGKRVLHYGDIHTNLPSHIKSVLGFPTANTDALSYLSDKQRIQCGDVVLADASEDYNDVGKAVEFIAEPEEDTFAGLHTILFRPDAKNFAKGYLAYALQGWPMRLGIMRLSQGAKVLGLSKSYFQQLEIHPHDIEEQKKISGILSAVDEKLAVIEAQLEGWRNFKRGMMQVIFTQTVRFNADDGSNFPNWESRELGELYEFKSGGTPSMKVDAYWNGDIPWVSAASMHKSEIIKTDRMVTDLGAENGTRKAGANTILILVRGSMLYKRIPICITKVDLVFNQDVKALEPIHPILPRYTLYGLQSMEAYLLSLISRTGMGAGKLATDLLKSLEFSVPSLPEQQKIADYLSALDSKIDALTERLEAMREFKRGLLQKMFV